jgi:predicted MFS family arabinose efflux permease
LSNFGFVFGALIGGTVVTLYGSGWALLVDAISFTIAGLLVWNINLPPMPEREKNSMFHDLKIGWFEFISRSWVVAVVIGFTFMNLCFEATISVLGPLAFNSGGHGPRNWSYNLAVITTGMIAGGIISMKIHFSRPLVLGMVSVALVPAWIFFMGFNLPLAIILLGAFIAGVAVEIFSVVWGTSMQTNIPKESYSRVVSYDAFGSYALAPIGIAFAGPVVSWIGISHTLVIAASVALVAALLPLTLKSVRELKYQSTLP